MIRIYDTFLAGGFVMWPLLGLSVVTFACALERSWFWFKLTFEEKQVVHEVLTAAKVDLDKAYRIAERSQGLAIGRFLAAPLKLINPIPENFHLALKAASDKEFVEMRQGDRLLESVIAIAPLLGILGTAGGLITTFGNLRSAEVNNTRASLVTAGIGEALISSAAGISLAITAFVFFRIFTTMQSRQIDFFSQVGNELELIYLQQWREPVKTLGISRSNQYPNTNSQDSTNI
jgi:biopolymer transport protein ExbB